MLYFTEQWFSVFSWICQFSMVFPFYIFNPLATVAPLMILWIWSKLKNYSFTNIIFKIL